MQRMKVLFFPLMRSGKTLKSLSHFKDETRRGLRPNNSTLADEASMKEHKFTIGRSRKCDIVLADDTVAITWDSDHFPYGFSNGNDDQQAKDTGVRGFLMKPLVIGDLSEMVKKVLDESKSSTQQ
jgi:hypothetical protein